MNQEAQPSLLAPKILTMSVIKQLTNPTLSQAKFNDFLARLEQDLAGHCFEVVEDSYVTCVDGHYLDIQLTCDNYHDMADYMEVECWSYNPKTCQPNHDNLALNFFFPVSTLKQLCQLAVSNA